MFCSHECVNNERDCAISAEEMIKFGKKGLHIEILRGFGFLKFLGFNKILYAKIIIF